MSTESKPESKKLWNPYVAGIFLGVVLLVSFVTTGKGLGASGGFKHLGAAILHWAAPTWAEENKLIGHYFSPERGALNEWIVFLGVGLAIGGLIGAVTGGRVKMEVVKGPRISRDSRLVLALVGGFFGGVGAAIARGCTSGQGLTGGAELAVGSWAFLFSMFLVAYLLSFFTRREWL